MFGETYLEPQSVINDAFRTFLSAIDRPLYGILGVVYQLFFNVASADIFSGEMIVNFYSRVQLIIGVFMMFQLAMMILKGIVNPDIVSDSKSGMGNIVVRISTSLILLALVVPINLSGGGNELEKQINNNGILFGSLYSLQNRILSNNTIGRLVLGVKGNESNYVYSSNGESIDTTDLETSSRVFTATVLKAFYRINLLPKEQRKEPPEGKSDDQVNANRVCQDIPDSIRNTYTRLDADPGSIIDLVNKTCLVDNNPVAQLGSKLDYYNLSGNKVYMFVYTPVISTIAAVILVIILLGFTVDIAVRSIKLAILRLIAPIPIIKHMNPQGSGDESLSAWGKAVTSTYLDLFLRLILVYFIIFVVQQMIINGIVINQADGPLGIFSIVLIIIALFMFAKEAPKFIKQAMGMKDDGGNMFAGIGAIAGFGAAVGGSVGSAATGWRAAHEEGKALYKNAWDKGGVKGGLLRAWSAARTGAATLGGAAGGLYAGGKALVGKDASAASVRAAQNQVNARRAAHSTLLGRGLDSGFGMITGQSLADRGNAKLEAAQNFVKAAGEWKTAVEDAAKENGNRVRLGHDNNGREIVARYEELERAVANAEGGVVTIGGEQYDSNLFTQSFMDGALKAQVADYQLGGKEHTKPGGDYYDVLKGEGQKLYKKYQDAQRAAGDVKLEVQPGNEYNLDNVRTTGANIGAANKIISEQENSMKQRMRRSNAQNKKGGS